MVRGYIIFLLLGLAISFGAFGQDTLFLMSGRMKTNISVMHMDSVKILYVPSHRSDINNQGRVPLKSRERQNVFRFAMKTGHENWLTFRIHLDILLLPSRPARMYMGATMLLSIRTTA